MFLLPSLLALACAAPLQGDVADHLALLRAEEAGRRREAQRWLARHLSREDYPVLAFQASSGDGEFRVRLAQALGSEDRHLGLVALLLDDLDPRAAALGEAAAREALRRWDPSLFDPPRPARRLPREWEEQWTRPYALAGERGDLAERIDRLDRLGGGPAPLVLDPTLLGWRGETGEGGEPLVGSWGELVAAITGEAGVSFEVHAWREGGESGGGHPWVRICKRGTEGRASGGELLLRWLRASARPYDPGGSAAACRALAQSGWPAALEWLGERWERSADEAALAGLLDGAARGRVAAALRPAAAPRALLARLSDHPGQAPLIAHALAGLAACTSDGALLADILTEGWGRADDLGRWVRLVAFEGLGVPAPQASPLCRELLQLDSTPPWLARQALRAFVVVASPGEAPLEVGGTLFERVTDAGQAEELARELVAAGARPAGGWAGGWAGEPPSSGGRGAAAPAPATLARALWALGAGEVTLGRRQLWRLLDGGSDPRALARILARWERGVAAGALAAEAGAGEGGAPPTWRRLLLLAGAVPPAELEARLDELISRDGWNADELAELGAAAGLAGVTGVRGREALVRALGSGAAAGDLRVALELAFSGLERGGEGVIAEAFAHRLRALAASEGNPILGDLVAGRLAQGVLGEEPPLSLDAAERLPEAP